MFENIIAQPRVVEQLTSEIREQRLPQSLLFYGSPYTGKLSTALELARVLTCEKENAEWNCTCSACERQRLLIHPNTIMLGSRYFIQEIAASADVFKRTDKRFARYMLIRAVRKLERRFDDFLWEKNETKLKKVYPLLQELEDTIEQIDPTRQEKTPENKDALQKVVQTINDLSKKITTEVSLENIPIDIIRNVSSWAHTTSATQRKIVIIENSHKMLESARNSLLKILEEPPQGVYFILLCPTKSSLISTILSRLRHYFFTPRNEEQTDIVLEKIFREPGRQYKTLEEYFLAWTSVNLELIDKTVHAFIESVLSHDPEMHLFWAENDRLFFPRDKEQCRLFLSRLLLRINTIVREYVTKTDYSTPMQTIIETWASHIRTTSFNIDIYNQHSQLALDSLFQKMRRTL